MTPFEWIVFIIILLALLGLAAWVAWKYFGWNPFGGGAPPVVAPTPGGGTPPPPPPPPAARRYILSIVGDRAGGPAPTQFTDTPAAILVKVNFQGSSFTGMTLGGHTVKAFIHPGTDGQTTSDFQGVNEGVTNANGEVWFWITATNDGEDDRVEASITNLSSADTSGAPVSSATHSYSTDVP